MRTRDSSSSSASDEPGPARANRQCEVEYAPSAFLERSLSDANPVRRPHKVFRYAIRLLMSFAESLPAKGGIGMGLPCGLPFSFCSRPLPTVAGLGEKGGGWFSNGPFSPG